jgi:hypothetical protein
VYCHRVSTKCVLPPGVNPIAVDKYIDIDINPVVRVLFSFAFRRLPKITKSDFWFSHVCSFAWNKALYEILYLIIFGNRPITFKDPLKYGKSNVALHKELRIFIITSLLFLIILRNVLDKGSRENKTHISCSLPFISPKIVQLIQIMWKKMVEPDRSHRTIWRIRFTHWLTKATDSQCKCIIFIHFPWQKRLRERDSFLRLYVQCLSY